MERISKENYYLDIAQTVAERSTCLRKKYGAIIVKNDTIVSTGYVGAPRGRKNCSDICRCMRDEMNIPRGERYEMCRSVHAEMNAIINASREQMLDGVMYLAGVDAKTGELVKNACCCMMCKRLVLNAGITKVIVRETKDEFTVYETADWIENDDSLSGKFGY
ncbi:MAG: cytidine deaminase [Clostridiales bacterium]|nr:MAG: cytidine deaminase [Clostridiales bacterium]